MRNTALTDACLQIPEHGAPKKGMTSCARTSAASKIRFAVLALAAFVFASTLAPAVAVISRHRHLKLYGSEYFSLHKTSPMPNMDLSQPGAIDTVLAHRSYKKEIIITCFTESAIRWMVHYGRMVQALGFDHFVVLTNAEPACHELERAWCSDFETADSEGNATCASTYPGCSWFTPEALPDAAGWAAARRISVESLWLWRYHVAAQFLRRGVNVLMSDLDVVIHGDFYRAVKSGPVGGYQFLQMPCSDSPNGGLWYIQNAHPRGPVVRMLEESVRIGLRVVELRSENLFPSDVVRRMSLAWKCSWVDQDVLEYMLLSATTNRSRLDWSCIPAGIDVASEWEKTFGEREGPPPRAWVGVGPAKRAVPWEYLIETEDARQNFTTEQLLTNRYAEPPQVAESCLTPEECARQKAYVLRQALFWPSMGADVFLLKDLESDPPARDDATSDAAVMAAAAAAAGPVPGKERALYTPMYLFNAAEVMQRGWATPRLEPWGLVTHLVGFGDAWGQNTGSRSNRMHLVQVLDLWHAPAPTPERLLRVAPALARATAALPTDRPFRQLIRALMFAAAMTGRVPVLPAVPCEGVPWLLRDPYALHGFYDPHFFTYLRDPKGSTSGEDNVMCTPALSAGEKCNDKVVMSDFHLDRDMLYPSYSHETLALNATAQGRAHFEAVDAFKTALAGLGAGADARVLWLRGEPEAAVRLSGGDEVTDMEGLLKRSATDGGQGAWARLQVIAASCPDFLNPAESLAKGGVWVR